MNHSSDRYKPMGDLARPNHKHVNQTKVLLDDEFEDLLRCAARIHRTPKAVLAREVLKSWLLSLASDSKSDSHAA
ncbi:hypothetical protein [Azotobacter chroococcum]|uniref:Ribbon-helix-helix protein CopG domain-containing protein n=2 Tax=Azotobacter chroococcum TaxID=353 RepID=A0A0C4WT56_9GAMM|nr:hypothetical protein [Azotobacter chroococcum]AJE21477.1 Hypothetical protein Achr_20260 [Azotobacter chroococcum NCIMB 8003]